MSSIWRQAAKAERKLKAKIGRQTKIKCSDYSYFTYLELVVILRRTYKTNNNQSSNKSSNNKTNNICIFCNIISKYHSLRFKNNNYLHLRNNTSKINKNVKIRTKINIKRVTTKRTAIKNHAFL